jgi:D-serine deaminase-like pyridoxal phosphate-dependent protein
MAAAGIRDILVANQVVGDQKVARLANLQRQADVMVAIDDPVHVRSISDAAVAAGVQVRVLVEVNIGLDRCGVEPGRPAVELARAAEKAPGVVFAGLMGYEGHVMALPDPEKKVACEKALSLLDATRRDVAAAGLPCGIVSTGGTGSLAFTPDLPGVTEIQAGGGVMYDTYYEKGLHVRGLEHALTLLTTVVSHADPSRAVVDMGRKTVHGAYQMPVAVGRPDITVVSLSAEHGKLSLDGSGPPLAVGQKLEVISGYSDMTVFLHDRMYGTRNGRVEVVWDILGRGRLD